MISSQEVLRKVREMRDETNALCADDLLWADGTVAMSKDKQIAVRSQYDDLISQLSSRNA